MFLPVAAATSGGRAPLDLGGRRFGRLVVLGFVRRIRDGGRSRVIWSCLCDCGTTADKRACNLLSGHTTSCGCYSGGPLDAGECEFNKLLWRYKYWAKKKGRAFDLTSEQFRALTKGDCRYCGAPPSRMSKGKNSYGAYTGNGVDRLNNAGGYTVGNAVSCCFTCNDMKGRLDEHAFLDRVQAIVERVGKLEGE